MKKNNKSVQVRTVAGSGRDIDTVMSSSLADNARLGNFERKHSCGFIPRRGRLTPIRGSQTKSLAPEDPISPTGHTCGRVTKGRALNVEPCLFERVVRHPNPNCMKFVESVAYQCKYASLSTYDATCHPPITPIVEPALLCFTNSRLIPLTTRRYLSGRLSYPIHQFLIKICTSLYCSCIVRLKMYWKVVAEILHGLKRSTRLCQWDLLFW